MITFMQAFLQELEHERIGTRKMLALVPADKATFKPHEKSMALKDLATHIADLPSWISLALVQDELDFATSPYNPPNCANAEELLAYFDKNYQEAHANLSTYDDSVLEQIWTLKNGDIIYMQANKLQTIRHSFCQLVHHRAQLGVYLRLLNIPIPGVYGPSADESGM
ncbi:MAG: damage-inducible protein DinB [Bacteroidetes bacterium B1(2017)]|nr:MAG: damage-inducible protein DinB [Bacteroidetes bacterium B1(2017)]